MMPNMRLQPTLGKPSRLKRGVRRQEMPVFAGMLRGENFEIAIEDSPQRLGFFTTRFVRAQSEAEAEKNAAVAVVRKHQDLRAAVRPDSPHTPMIYLESIERRPWWHLFKRQQGLSFWDMDAELGEEPSNNSFEGDARNARASS